MGMKSEEGILGHLILHVLRESTLFLLQFNSLLS